MQNMTRAGRFNPIVVIGLISIAMIVVTLLFTRDQPTQAANRFMIALGRGQVDELMELSTFEGSADQIRKQWEYATQVAGPHYRFVYRILEYTPQGDNQAAVRIGLTRNVFGDAPYEELYDLPLRKVDGKWKVEVRNLARDMYPALPR
ncbi:MAG TPA: hypothetical protein PLO61_05055 [Fimbriimonadaceae bacterium]|nr:hypothetical protein [Fimbriimonadaceae bacterium]HRJ32587.1 hypothetical protein [Fimbriimonadaceae bacterium]